MNPRPWESDIELAWRKAVDTANAKDQINAIVSTFLSRFSSSKEDGDDGMSVVVCTHSSKGYPHLENVHLHQVSYCITAGR